MQTQHKHDVPITPEPAQHLHQQMKVLFSSATAIIGTTETHTHTHQRQETLRRWKRRMWKYLRDRTRSLYSGGFILLDEEEQEERSSDQNTDNVGG